MRITEHAGKDGGIQALRAIACLLVLVQHVTFFVCELKGLDYRNYLMINYGRMGVSLFFVISGFVMGHCLNQGSRFMWNRAVRIYPPFWLAVLVSFALFHNSPAGWRFDWWSAFLLPTTELNNSYRIPYWTLCYEMAFYVAAFAMVGMRLSRKSVLIVCILWMLAILMYDAYRPIADIESQAGFGLVAQPGYFILLSPYSVFFVGGLIVSVAGTAFLEKVPTEYLLLTSMGLWFACHGIKFMSTAPMFLVELASFILALAAARRLRFHRAIVHLGDYSYGIYLIHIMVIVAIAEVIRADAGSTRFSILWLGLMAASLSAGIAFGWMEYHLHVRLFKGRRPISNQQPVSAPPQ